MLNIKYHDSYIEISHNFTYNEKNHIIGFDLDHTLIKPINNKTFYDPNDKNGWEFFNSTIINKLRTLDKLDYKIVIITNQNKLIEKNNHIIWIEKIKKFIKLVKVPILIIALVKDNNYRKPLPTIWQTYFANNKKAFYCGDACGFPDRVINGIKYKKDFSDTDLKFAINCGIDFISRDDFIICGKFISKELPYKYPKLQVKNTNKIIPITEKTLIINVGIPGSGKTTFTLNNYPNLVYINNDTMKNTLIINLLNNAFTNKKSIVIDNTNNSLNNRKKYIDMGKKYNYKIICNYFKVDILVAKHNNNYRSYISNNTIKKAPDIAYHMYNKYFQEPTLAEGFDIINIIKFNNINKDKNYYLLFF